MSEAAPLLLVDLASIVYPLWHMSGDDPDVNATSVKAVAKVRELASSHEHVAIASEGGRPFRKDIDPTYKANRPEKNEPLNEQIRRTEARLREDGYPIWRADGFEADDIIATAAMKAMEAERTVLIATADKDLMQLVCSDVCVLSTKTGDLIGPHEVESKFGVTPAQMRDYLTLVGDSADNIKGAPGIGAVKAKDLLRQFGTLDVVMASLDQLTNGTAKSLRENGLALERARALVTLRTDAPLPFDDIFKPRVRAERTEQMADMLDSPETVMAETTSETRPVAASAPATFAPERETETALARVSPVVIDAAPNWEKQLEPRTLGDARVLAKWMFASQHFSAYGSPEAVMSVILAGRELGIGAMASLRGFHVVKGRITMAADLMRALVLSSGKAEYFTCKERGPKSSTWVTKRKGDPTETTLTYTAEEAKAAGLVSSGSGWEKHPADMVAKTASAKLARLAYADLLFGMYSPAEIGGDDDI